LFVSATDYGRPFVQAKFMLEVDVPQRDHAEVCVHTIVSSQDTVKKERITGKHRWSAGVVHRVVEGPTRHGEVMRARKNPPAIMVASTRLDANKTLRLSAQSEKNPRGEFRMVTR
jgi:hypothetical protein